MVLENDKTLEYYNINSNSSLHFSNFSYEPEYETEFTVFIKTMTGNTIPLKLNTKDTVKIVK